LAKEDLVEFDGQIIELLPEGRFRVRLENDHEILAYTAGKMTRTASAPWSETRSPWK